MYLRSLTVAGFKSFADRTRLSFEPGVTVVVGPNGSGKSNLVDAVAWVLGTQAPSSLRTQRMEDVIFAGTATRPALSRAEVVLTLDNGQRLLDLDLDEVTLTRRLYRDGTSEYEINGTPCRLLDVQELLSDSHVGRHQHVIVGQGQLDSVLNAKPDEHRAIIEEAAGILKHRLRKDRSVRRLERTDADLLRLTDILAEVKRQMRPLRRQARAAERHEAVRAEARALRTWLGGEELRTIRSRLDQGRGREASDRAELARVEADLQEMEGSLSQLAREAGEAGKALDRDTAAAARLETTAERLRRIGQVARERRRALQARVEGAGERRRDLEEEAQQLESELATGAEEERHARLQADRSEATLRSLEDEERSLAEQEALPAEGAAAVVRGDLSALQAASDRDRREMASIAHRIEVLDALIGDEHQQIERLDEDIQLVDALAGQASAEYERARAARVEDQAAWEEAETVDQQARVTLAEAAARVEALEAAVDWGDAGRQRAREADGVIGDVVQLLDPPDGLGRAVEAALAPFRYGIAAEGREATRNVISELKAEGLGGVALVVGGESPPGEPIARAVARRWGLDALVDLLGPRADRSLATLLVGDVVLVEGWSSAWEVVHRHPDIRAVTPEGDLVTSVGMRMADPDAATPAGLDSARRAREDAELAAARATSRLTTARRSFEQTRSRERVALECLEALEARMAGSVEAVDRLRRNREANREELERLAARRDVIRAAEVDREERAGELRRRLTALEGEESARRAAWDELTRRRRDVAQQRDAARRSREQAAEALGAIVERRRMLERRLADVRGELQQHTDRPADPGRIAQLSGIESVARTSLEAVRAHIDTLRERQATFREASGEAGAALTAARDRQEHLRRRSAELRDQLATLAVEVAELQVRREAVAEGLRRDVDVDEDAALAEPHPELDPGVDPAERLATVEAQLRRMGPINPLAAAEYRDLEERASFMEGQLADLQESRSELRKVIRALDDEMKSLFMTAFDEVARHYQESFTVLFPGGRGRLRLSDPDDPLASGVEIEAQPLGKKVSRLSLLSGGERSLAALAFLFAVFKARPSPFYILDEVEAALDHANLHRFLLLVDQLRDTAQVLVVTHQQQTMEAADILYGVTMEPGGSSSVVAKRFSSALV